tara:strand:+ start:771 stop:1100 length:330 start_codon:yes stop_codon:yes gene_type:complete
MRYQAALHSEWKFYSLITYLFNNQKKAEMILNVNIYYSLWGPLGGRTKNKRSIKTTLISCEYFDLGVVLGAVRSTLSAWVLIKLNCFCCNLKPTKRKERKDEQRKTNRK